MSTLAPPQELSRQARIAELNHHNTQSPRHALQQRVSISQLDLLWSKREWAYRYTFAQDVDLIHYPPGPSYHAKNCAPDFFIVKKNWIWEADDHEQRSYSISKEGHVPEVVIEIGASLENENDYLDKCDDYMAMGVAEYFIWDLTQQQIVCYRMIDGETTQKIVYHGQPIYCRELDIRFMLKDKLVHILDDTGQPLILPSGYDKEIRRMELKLKVSAAQTEAALQREKSAIAEKESAIAEKESAIAEKESAIAEKESALERERQAQAELARLKAALNQQSD